MKSEHPSRVQEQENHTSLTGSPAGSNRKPRLLILSPVARADLVEPLSLFKRFEVWHLYHIRSRDMSPAQDNHSAQVTSLFDLANKVRAIRPDVIQGSEPYYVPWGLYFSVVARHIARQMHVPYFFPTLENLSPETKFGRVRLLGLPIGRMAAPLLRRFMSNYARDACLVFGINREAREHLASLGVPRDKIVDCLYGTWGVDLGRFSPEKSGGEPDWGQHAVLYVGRLVEEKGIADLLNAFLVVKNRLPDARLVFIGGGPMAKHIRQFARQHSIEDSVLLLGQILNQDLPEYFRAARCTAAPSVATERWAEQVGMVNIQSIACGTPVVSTRSGSIPEFIKDGVSGILVPERDPAALARAIIGIMEDARLHRRLSIGGRAAAVQRYDRCTNILRAEELIIRAVNRGRKPDLPR